MADPLLNTLCSICHISTPKYTCPGCNTHTCSLECNKKHKSWANCSGKRDPTAYMPPSKLKTAAGIDHDYNFLSAIERERERNQREIVDERGLFSQKELGSQLDDPFSFRKQWFGDDVRFHPVGGGGGGGEPRMFASDGEDSGEDGAGPGAEARHNRRNIPAKASQLTQRVRQRLAAENVRVVQMPVGMTRQRENTTMWNRKARRINWCVEWMLYGDSGSGDGKEEEEAGLNKKPTRIRHNALETMPLYKALGNSVAWYKKGQEAGDDAADDEDVEPAQAGRRKRVLIREVKETEQRGGGGAMTMMMQDGGSATWHPRTQYPTQSPFTAAWSSDAGATTTSWDADGEVEARRRHRFYLLRPLTVAGKSKELIPVSATEDLSAALAGRTVLEYPTIYVLPPPPRPSADPASSTAETASPPLPEGHVLGSTERRPPPKRQQQQQQAAAAAKRKAAPGSRDDPTSRQQPSQKRQAISGGGRGAGEAGLPVRQSDRSQRGRGNATTSARGRGRAGRGGAGRPTPGRRHAGAADPDAEEGEVNSDGDEVMAAAAAAAAAERADTSSSDPDSSGSSDDDDEEDDDAQDSGFWRASGRPRGGGMVVDDGDEGAKNNSSSPRKADTTASAQAAQALQGNGTKKPGGGGGMGLVDYGSDSSGEEEDGSEDDGDADPATLKPENPELVAGAIQEIVGLLS
ncbi:hypothetical protein KVR01_007197 [Diaporthe batatas]|uniref:uncharacterized protein n=1 Tax=Diaporthe batatas TaxID=748121 RepID=UPI001D053776|nr:uncharacterized protein KVR01_007197 [Diaporthe batatas]KAG8162719.1 hypothetical protein KVR01_007197 [Diaporthe batatas]